MKCEVVDNIVKRASVGKFFDTLHTAPQSSGSPRGMKTSRSVHTFEEQKSKNLASKTSTQETLNENSASEETEDSDSEQDKDEREKDSFDSYEGFDFDESDEERKKRKAKSKKKSEGRQPENYEDLNLSFEL